MESLPFGDLLKTLRKRRRLTQYDLARKLGKHINTIGTWERGECLPNGKSMVLELAKALRLDEMETKHLLEASLTALTPYWNVPYQRNLFFTGRKALLAVLHTRLALPCATACTQTQLVALYGLGGIGKTQLAVEYAYQHALEYQAIFWIEAESVETITGSFQQIARHIHLPEKQDRLVEEVQRWLLCHSHWLLIWDNLGNLELLRQFLPPTRQGSILLTMRSRTLEPTIQTLEVLPMSLNEGERFLFLRAKGLAGPARREPANQPLKGTPGEYRAAEELATLMGGLPLALDQVGAYINETGRNLADYLQRYQRQQRQLLNRRGVLGDHPCSVTTTFIQMFQRIQQDYPAAADILSLCAFLYPDAIPEEIFTQSVRDANVRLRAIMKNALLLDTALAALCGCSLLQRRPSERTFFVHRLVQVVLLETLKEAEQRLWAEQAVLVVSQAFPPVEHNTWLQCERLLPQALTALQMINQYQITREEADGLFVRTSCYLRTRTRYIQDPPLFQQTRGLQELIAKLEGVESTVA
ncbi:MAG TPA: NB-ARC domain-containing protein [Ktedonobacteraceae bacterium]